MALCLIVCASTFAGGATPVAKIAPAPVPRSVFVDVPDKGKDPFFPGSTRRIRVAPALATSTTNAVPETSALFNLLQLKGISGTRTERLAIINSSTIGEGETADIRCGVQQVLRVRCREIRDDSVLVELVGMGEMRELKLRKNI